MSHNNSDNNSDNKTIVTRIEIIYSACMCMCVWDTRYHSNSLNKTVDSTIRKYYSNSLNKTVNSFLLFAIIRE